jgi:hypothetical protein
LVLKPEDERSLGRPRSRWENNIIMYLSEVGCDRVNWSYPPQVREK